LAGEVRGVVGGDLDDVPAGFVLADVGEVGGVVVGVADGEQVGVGAGGEGVGGVPEGLGDAAGLVEHDEQVAGVDALERRLRVVGGLAAVGDELAVDLPFGGLGYPPGQAGLFVALAALAPTERPPLAGPRAGGDHAR